MAPDEGASAYEHQHVHSVYSAIAPHFSQTRHKPWPLISSFLQSQPAGSVGLDLGCGNGKYLAVNPDIYIVGSDWSSELVRIAQHEKCRGQRQSDVLVCDILSLPHSDEHNSEVTLSQSRACRGFDFAFSVAVVHHLSTRERRVHAIGCILSTLRRGRSDIHELQIVQDTLGDTGGSIIPGNESHGTALIYVWALEQKSSRRGWAEGDDQDVKVPWVMKEHDGSDKRVPDEDHVEGSSREQKVFKRYYHLYRQGELEEDIQRAGGLVLDSGYEKDNWWAIATRNMQLPDPFHDDLSVKKNLRQVLPMDYADREESEAFPASSSRKTA